MTHTTRRTTAASLLFTTLLLLLLGALCVVLPSRAGAEAEEAAPDPLDRGPYEVSRLDPFKAGLYRHQEPNSNGGVATGAASPVEFQVRGSMYTPADYEGRSPILVFVHGNHGSCDSGSAPDCAIFKRNDAGYAYLGENLASWGYAVFSLDQDQLMSRQDGSFGKGMHARRLLITALLDALYEANESGLPDDEDTNLGDKLVGKLDFTRIGLMGHSRGGDAVSSFIDWNRMRPTGRRYPLRGVISLAPVDYERHAPYGTPYMTILPWCDGDVSNLQGARFYERSQHTGYDPYPRIQSSQLGANHNWYNTVWFADGQDGPSGNDQACRDTQPSHSRLSGSAGAEPHLNYVIDNSDKLNPEVNTRISGDPSRMGDQEKIGLATMAAFFRRYVGGEGAFEPYLTGELNERGKPQIPESACPTSAGGVRMPCIERVSNSYFPGPSERLDVIVPGADRPLRTSALGTAIEASGFAYPYLEAGGVQPAPPATESGIDWCNPEPLHSLPNQLGISGRPTAAKPCPLPADGALGGQSGTRENAPVNHSYGRQLAIAWDDPVGASGKPATLATAIPAALGDVSGFKALAMGADVNFFDPRNPAREDDDPATPDEALWNPAATTQDFTIALVDAEGNEGTVSAADQRYGNALHQTTGSTTARVHVVLDQIRVPLADFADQGVDLSAVRRLELRFGEPGKPASGSIQLADVRFQEPVEGTGLLLDSTEPGAGPGEGPPPTGPDPAEELEAYDRAPQALSLPDVSAVPTANRWTVDDDKAQCPDAAFTKIQDAIDHAAPWDTVVVCAGTYEEASVPVHHNANPVQAGSRNGLTITKPLKIKGAGADLVTIRPAPELGPSLAGTAPYLRDGGGNVVTVSRQSLGSTDDVELFVDISGVTIESPSIYAEAGVAFFNAAGRISNSVVGPLKRSTNGTELAERPHGWGIAVTNHLVGSGPGTVLRRVTVADSLVHGYQAGGILFDEAKGPDGDALNTAPAGIAIEGYVDGTIVQGGGPSSLIAQTGIRYHAGAAGAVTRSRVVDNRFPTDQRRSVGVLLTGADTDRWSLSGSAIAGNGYGVFNADIENATIRQGAAAAAGGNWWGPGGPPIEGPSLLGSGIEGISGPDEEAAASVLTEPVLATAPEVPGPGPIADADPSAALVDPGDGERVAPGEPIVARVLASDDFGVASVALSVDGEQLAARSHSPYEFVWTPSAEQAGETVTLEATVTDSAGRTATDSIEVEVEAAPQAPAAEEPQPTPAPPAAPAAGSPAPPAPRIEAKLRRNPRRGTATLVIAHSGPGRLTVSGPGLVKATSRVTAAGRTAIALKLDAKARRALAAKGRVTVVARVSFVPAGGGSPIAKARRVVLIKRP